MVQLIYIVENRHSIFLSFHRSECIYFIYYSDVRFITITNAQALLSGLESASNYTGLYLNEIEMHPSTLVTTFKTLSNNILKYFEDYKYNGSHILNSEKDIDRV